MEGIFNGLERVLQRFIVGILVFSIVLGAALIPATGFIYAVLLRQSFEGRGLIYLWISNSIFIYFYMT